MSEADYLRGQRAVWRKLFLECLTNLGYDSREAMGWMVEREEAIAILRSVCEDHGDNEWDEKLHLADIIEKHLYKHLESE